jgi:hypothetical protein
VKVDIRVIRPTETLLGLLLRDGWMMEAGEGPGFCVSHPQVGNEAEARGRLDRLGLLTSGRLVIAFRPSEPRRP